MLTYACGDDRPKTGQWSIISSFNGTAVKKFEALKTTYEEFYRRHSLINQFWVSIMKSRKESIFVGFRPKSDPSQEKRAVISAPF